MKPSAHLGLTLLAMASCAPDLAGRHEDLDTIPTRILMGVGDPVVVAQCAYDRILTLDCQGASQRHLMVRAPEGGVIVMCDDHPGYAGLQQGRSGSATPEGAMTGALFDAFSRANVAAAEDIPGHFPAYSLRLRMIAGDGLEGTVWALGDRKAKRRLQMLTEAFSACAA